MNLYFSGFSLNNEQDIFQDIINKSDFTVSGFSYGAIKAFDYVLNCNTRVDTLQLISPAFFQTKDKKYKRLQLMFFNKDKKQYCNNFIQNTTYGSSIDLKPYLKHGSQNELEELLYYNWDKSKLEDLIDKGIKIEVYLGEDDKIIDSSEAYKFFKEFSTVYLIKNKGHIL
jgi:alpha-beta hydrolase superfamily lysophospholipase